MVSNGKTYLLHQHEALGVGDDLGGVQSLLEVVEELLLVAGELLLPALELEEAGSLGALVLDGGQAAGQDGLGDEGDGLAEVKSVDGGPLAGTLLAGLVEDLLDERGAIVVVEVEDVAGDLNEEGVQDALVPLGEDVAHLLVGELKGTLHDVVGLGDESVGASWILGEIWQGHTSQMSCMSPYSIPLWTILT